MMNLNGPATRTFSSFTEFVEAAVDAFDSLAKSGPHFQIKAPETAPKPRRRIARSIIDPAYRDVVEHYRKLKPYWTFVEFGANSGVDERTLRKFIKTGKISFETRDAIDTCMAVYPKHEPRPVSAR